MTGFIVGLLATILSFSRAAVISLVIAVVWVFWKSRSQMNAPRRSPIVLLAALALVLLLAAGAIRSVLQERVANLFTQGLAEESTITRYLVIVESLGEVPDHPLLGGGTASFQLSFNWSKYVPEWANNSTWVGNVVVRILHDTGLIGLAAFLWLPILLWSKVRQSLRGRNAQPPILIGLSAGVILYGISFQSTDGTILAFFWVHFGFLASAAILMNDSGLISGGNNERLIIDAAPKAL
jgi:O-antigen ligase